MNVFLVPFPTSTRAESNTLNTFIYVAGAQIEDGAFAASYIPTDTATVTRVADILEPNPAFTRASAATRVDAQGLIETPAQPPQPQPQPQPQQTRLPMDFYSSFIIV